jgi:hypothetical protein
VITAYNFVGSWQLFPEKGTYEYGHRPKSGIYKLETTENKKELIISMNWVTLENQAFSSDYTVIADGDLHPFKDQQGEGGYDSMKVEFIDALNFNSFFYRNDQAVLEISNELLPNGYLRITQKGTSPEGTAFTNTEVYHKQLSVMPYSASVSGAVVKANEEGIIRHKALNAMEEQTNMQLQQIRKQIELLALQAQEIQMRKELSMIIYNAKLSFSPVIGNIYYLYERQDGSHFVSMVSEKEWGGSGPFKRLVAAVRLLADHTWVEV